MNIVMDIMEGDLKKFIDKNVRLTECHVKCLMRQLLQGLEQLHAAFFVHRDLSPANVFINKAGVCKVADFGLARSFGWHAEGSPVLSRAARTSQQQQHRFRPTMTAKTVTLWYRPAELIFGANLYGSAIDMWSCGCVFAELLLGRALFPGLNEIDQLGKIFELCGTPSDSLWPEARALPYFAPFTHKLPGGLETKLKGTSAEAVNLLQKMLQLDPHKRISATEALEHVYFSSIPLPCKPAELPVEYL
eukprot:GHVT01065052.1.p1 GENE.GHVT01065052.1~~GHVT01065052.1.p1  ORF type:complete len:247 (+),score=59.23 GHVT01065052.1:788-1528(+)